MTVPTIHILTVENKNLAEFMANLGSLTAKKVGYDKNKGVTTFKIVINRTWQVKK